MILTNIYPVYSEMMHFFPINETQDSQSTKLMDNNFGNYEKYRVLKGFSYQAYPELNFLIFGRGLFAIEISHRVDRQSEWLSSIEKLIETASEEREKLKKIINSPEFKKYLADNKIQGELKIAEVFSHNLFSFTKESFDELSAIFGQREKSIVELSNINRVSINATINIFELNYNYQKSDIEKIKEMSSSLTTFLSSLYQIQNICLTKSQNIVNKDFIVENESSIIDDHKMISYFNQHLIEMGNVNFVDDIFQEAIQKRISDAWRWDSIVQASRNCVIHFEKQIGKVEKIIKSNSDERENKLILAFTLLALVDTLAVILQLYDVSGELNVYLRLGSVFISFIVITFLIILYLRKK